MIKVAIVLALMVGTTSACTDRATSTMPARAPIYAGVYLDWSTSYQPFATRMAAQLEDDLLALVEPGSTGATIDVRLINENAWGETALRGRVTVPGIPNAPSPPDGCANPVDPERCATRASAQQATAAAYLPSVAAARADVAERLHGMLAVDEPPAQGTDILGTLAVAETELANAPAGARKFLIIVSDLRQCTATNCGLSAPAKINLSGVDVVVYGFGDAGDGDVVRVRDGFKWYFAGAGATHVRFLLPGQRLTDVINQ